MERYSITAYAMPATGNGMIPVHGFTDTEYFSDRKVACDRTGELRRHFENLYRDGVIENYSIELKDTENTHPEYNALAHSGVDMKTGTHVTVVDETIDGGGIVFIGETVMPPEKVESLAEIIGRALLPRE